MPGARGRARTPNNSVFDQSLHAYLRPPPSTAYLRSILSSHYPSYTLIQAESIFYKTPGSHVIARYVKSFYQNRSRSHSPRKCLGTRHHLPFSPL
ncbi:hypothetical protein EI94DRAFT_875287 [Lactarius quietus]|nr:hypothetical protein EI94DRAFT_875287 [Lactarius quietus]